jgi:lactoylglutathione lyase
MIHKLEHTGIMVKDMDASILFYTEVLQMHVVGRKQLTEEVELCFLSYAGFEDIQIELISGNKEHFPDERKVHHIAFTVSDIEAEVDRLRKLNIKLFDEQPTAILDGVKIAFFSGPDGELLEFYQPKGY